VTDDETTGTFDAVLYEFLLNLQNAGVKSNNRRARPQLSLFPLESPHPATMKRPPHTRVVLVILSALFLAAAGGCRHPRTIPDQQQKLAQAWDAYHNGKFGDALKLLDEFPASGSGDSLMAEAGLLVGQCRMQLGQYDSAVASFQDAVHLFHSSNNPKREQAASAAIADFRLRMGDYPTARAIALGSAGTSLLLHDTAAALQALSYGADALHQMGRYDEESGILARLFSLDSISSLPRPARSSISLRMLDAAIAAGQTGRARGFYEQATIEAPSGNDTTVIITAHCDWARTQAAAGHPDSALHALSRALSLLSSDASPALRIRVLSAIGILSCQAGHGDDALMNLTDALESARRDDNRSAAAILRLVMLKVKGDLAGDTRDSVRGDISDQTEAVLTECRRDGNTVGAALALLFQGRIEAQDYDTAKAISCFQEALTLHESMPDVFDDDELVSGAAALFLGRPADDWYTPLIDIAVARRDAAGLLELLEARNLRQTEEFFSRLTIRTQDANVNRVIADIMKARKETALVQRSLLSELSTGKRIAERMDALRAMLPVYSHETEQAADQLRSLSPNFHWLIRPGQIQSRLIRDSIAPGSALLEYLPMRDSLIILVATRDTVRLRTAPVGREHLLGMIDEYNRGAVTGFSDTPPARAKELSSLLGNLLWSPVLSDLADGSTITMVVPDDFSTLPLHALTVNGVPVLERYDLRYLPTAAALLFRMKSPNPSTDIIAFGCPGRSGWDVEYELRDIRSFIETARMVFSTLATAQYLDTASCRLLHIDAEFTLDLRAPDNSVCVLSDGYTPDGVRDVPLGEMLATTVPDALIMTNVSPITGGLRRYVPAALLARGTPVVVTTYWQGDRKAKRDFGETFYTKLQSGSDPRQAFREALLALGRQPDTPPGRGGLFFGYLR
jgi:tetratricopeptide (TPR) repeat protein